MLATKINPPVTLPIRVGIVGTGYAARVRAQSFQADGRSHLVAVAGHLQQRTQEFANEFAVQAASCWQELVEREDLDLVTICTINREHGQVVRAALNCGKHVVVEYPLSLDAIEAAEAIAKATDRGKLLHVEHIELLGGLHQAFKQSLPEIGNAAYVRYTTIAPKRPAPQHWNYHRELFGFPLAAALSRLHRLTDAFGKVTAVSSQLRYWEAGEYYRACLCTAQLRFANKVIADVVYGKGDVFWQRSRLLEVHGDKGTLVFEGDRGTLVRGEERTDIEVAGRRGLFAKDTRMVLDYLIEEIPLYVTPAASLYALEVANAARKSAETGQTIEV